MDGSKSAITSLNELRLIDTLDLLDPKTKRKCAWWSFPIAILASPLFIKATIIVLTNGHSPYLEMFLSLLIALVLIVPTYVLHELFHFVFQWTFSHRIPRLNLKPPWPYSALALGAHISRNQGIICALSPVVFVTSILVLLSMVANSQVEVILLMTAYIHAATCAGDFLLISWLFRHPRRLRYGTVGLANALLEPIDDKE